MNKRDVSTHEKSEPHSSEHVPTQLTPQQEKDAFGDTLISSIIGSVASVAGLGPLLGFSERWAGNREKKKEEDLILKLREQVTQNSKAVETLSSLLRDRKGFALFVKIIQLKRNVEIEDDFYDPLMTLLAQIIINVSSRNFEAQFSRLSYLISRIDNLSPQALLILSDSENWPKVNVGGTTMNKVTLSGDWMEKFVPAYLQGKNLKETDIGHRVTHSMAELEHGGYVKLGTSKRVELTEVGAEIEEELLHSA